GEKTIELNDVSRMKRRFSAQARFGDDYEPYQIPDDKIEYPSGGFVDQLLELKNNGEMKIVNDAPIDTYYVAALRKRVEPTVRDFEKDTATFAFQPTGSFFLNVLQAERRADFRNGIMQQLRAQAGLEIRPEVSKQLEERTDQ